MWVIPNIFSGNQWPWVFLSQRYTHYRNLKLKEKQQQIFVKFPFPCIQRKHSENCNKTSSKIYIYLLQQKLKQKVYNIDDVFFIRLIWF